MNTTVPTSSKLLKTATSAGKIMMLVFGFLLVFGNDVKAQTPLPPATQVSNVFISTVTSTSVTVRWTKGTTGGGTTDAAIFVTPGTTSTPPPFVTGTSPTSTSTGAVTTPFSGAGGSFTGGGTVIGPWTCVTTLLTTGGPSTVTNLTAGTAYTIIVVQYDVNGVSVNTAISATSGNIASFSTSNANSTLSGLVANNPDASSLTLNQTGSVPASTAFASGALNYTASVPNTETSFTVTPSLSDATNLGTITYTVNGVTIGTGTNGTASPSLPLNPGSNTILVKITSNDASTNTTYTLTVNRTGSSVSTLTNLVLSSGALTPAFPTPTPTGTSTYTAAAVPNATSFVTVTPTLTDATATITASVNGGTAVPVTNNTASPNLNLTVGSNTILVTATAQDGVTVNTFTITIVRQSNIGSLASLVPSAGTLSPAFTAGTGTSSYTIAVPNSTNILSLTPTVTDPTATITASLNGGASSPVTSGSPTTSLSLVTGSANVFSIVVTSQDGSVVDTYTVTVTRQSNVATLSSLITVPPSTFSPAFTAGATTSSYSTSLPTGTSFVALYPTATDPTATITVNGTVTASGSSSPEIPLNAGPNIITTVVTSQDGTVVNTYTLTVNVLSNIASLSNLTLTSPTTTLSPSFATGTFAYNASVAPGTSSIVVTPTSNSLGTITVQDGAGSPVAVTSGSPSAALPLVAGASPNVITVTVTSTDLSASQAYTINISDPTASTVSTLSAFTISSGTLSPAFVAGTGTSSYTATTPINTTSMTVTPTLTDPTATITVAVNGGTATAVTSGSPSGSLALVVGANTIVVTVTAQDGHTQSIYTLTETRPAASTNATLSALGLNTGTLSPVFAAGTTNYVVTEAAGTGAITVTPTLADLTASMTYAVNGGTPTVIGSGSATAAIALTTGVNTAVTVVVTAQDGVTKVTYTVNVTQAPVTAQQLTALTVTTLTTALTPTFSGATLNYNGGVLFATTSVTVTATLSGSTQTIAVNGGTATARTSGSPSTVTGLNVGVNTIVIGVTKSAITTNYTIFVTRAAASTNANLSALALTTPATLSPTFAAATTSYTSSVSNATTGTKVTATLADPTATMKVSVNGGTSTTLTTGVASATLALNVGNNTIAVVVTAQDNATIQTYNIVVNRISNVSTLSALTVSAGTLTPAFASGTLSYSVGQPLGTTSITITPTVTNSFATVKVNGVAATSGTGSLVTGLVTGNNIIPVVVTAQDGATISTYNVNVIVQSNVAALSALTISAGTLNPTFTTGTLAYAATVPFANATVTVTPTSSLAGTVTVAVNGGTPVAVTSGTASGALSLTNIGNTTNNIAIVVTSSDGTATATYNVVVTRQNNVATLSNLAVSAGTLTPTFVPGTLSYSTSVPNGTTSINVTPTLTDPNATITVNGTATASGTAATINGLVTGLNPVAIVVTSQDGSVVTTYNLTVIVQSSIASLTNLVLSSGALTPTFTTGQLTYTQSVPFATSTTTVTPTTSVGGTVTVNGTPVTSGSASAGILLLVGNTTITTVVTSSDNSTTATYTVVITRAPASTVNTLNTLTISTGTLSPVFATGTNSYIVNEASSTTTTVTVTPTVTDPTSTITAAVGAGTPVTVNSGSASSTLTLTQGAVNIISVVVTAQSGATNTYTINVSVPPVSTNNELSALTTTAGALTPTFTGASLAYTTPGVPYTTTSVTVSPTAVSFSAVLTAAVNGGTPVSVTSGGTSSALALSPGLNTITIVVSRSGLTGTYSIYVTRALPSSNATIATLTTSPGTTFTPTFTSGTNSYAATINATSFTVTPTLTSGVGTYSVNGATAVASGTTSAAIPLTIGTNSVAVVATAQDGVTTDTYNFTITRLSNIATLSNLVPSLGSLSPVFATATTSYSETLPPGTTAMTIMPTVTDPTATVTVAVNGVSVGTVASGANSPSLALNNGINNVVTTVTAQDGVTTLTYTDVVTVQANIALLSNIVLSSGTLTPAFASGTTSYTASIPYANAAAFTVTPTSQAAGTITVALGAGTPVAVASGAASAPLALAVGANTINIVVTSSDATANLTYSVVVTVAAPSTVSSLSALATTPALTLSPSPFATATLTYTASVPFATSAVTFTPTVTDPTSTVLVNGASAATPVSLVVGSNTVNIVVTAQDGVTQTTYTVTVTRGVASTVNTLSNLTINTGTLSPVFATGTNSYIVNEASSATTTVTITPTATDPTSTITAAVGAGTPVTVNSGSASSTLTLTQGAVNIISVVVTAQSGATNTYTINVSVPPVSTNNELSALTTTPTTTLSPTFTSASLAYTTSVPFATSSITVTPTPVSFSATMTAAVNGGTPVSVTAGTASSALALNPGVNTITIVVTRSGLTGTYSIQVTRLPASTNATLSNLTTTPTTTLSPTFASGTTSYTTNVLNAITSITVTPTFTSGVGTYTVNGGASTNSGTASPAIALNPGANVITIATLAQDGVTTSSYTLTVNRLSGTATLASLASSAGAISPAFVAGTGTSSYTETVPSTVTSVNITPTVTDPTSTVTVNGTTVPSGTASANITLVPGNNSITTVVTSQDLSTTSTYTLVITQQSAIASLSALTTTPAVTLSPTFTTGTTSYSASVLFATTAMTVTPTSNAAGTITVAVGAGTPVAVASGTASASLPLAVGANTITVAVTSTDGTVTTSYILTVTRGAASSIATLATLTTTPTETFTPTFAPATNTYAVTVPFATTALTFTPTTTDGTGTISVNSGTAVNSGVTSQSVSLSVGANAIPVTVTAQDGVTTNTYTVNVTRTAPTTTSSLSALTVSTGTLNPTFASGTTSYLVNETSSFTTTLTVRPTVTDPNATIKVNGTTVASGASSGTITLTVGGTTAITVVVTAQDGVTTTTYTINVAVPPSSANNELSALTISSGTLTPTFAAASLAYTDVVPFSVPTVTFTPTAVSGTATMTYSFNGGTATTIATATASAPLTLVTGTNTITIAVLRSGVTATYTITISHPAVSTVVTLASLTTTPTTTFTPTFATGTASYTTNVPFNTSAITVTPTTTDGNGTISVNGGTSFNSGVASPSITLNPGANVLTILITAQDGVTQGTYTLTVNRQSNTGTLASLTTTAGAFSPAFVAGTGTSSYSVTVPGTTTSTTVTPTATDPTSTIAVNGTTVASGSASGSIALNPGNNVITTVVTSQDGTVVNTYTLTVIQTSSIASLASLTTTPATTFTPAFASGTLTYAASVPFATTSITVTPTSNAAGTIAMTANGTTVGVTSGTASVPVTLAVGANTITLVVTSSDFTQTATYTLTVTRNIASSLSTLANLTTTPASTLAPTFTAGTLSYTTTVAATTASITLTPTTTDGTGSIAVNGGTAFSSGTASQSVALSIGATPITVVVTSQDGSSTSTYTLTVTRPAPATTATLSALTLTTPTTTLNPTFATSTLSYAATVATGTTSITVTPTLTDVTGTMKINGNSVTSGTPTVVSLGAAGSVTAIAIVVTAQDGVTTNTYTVNVGVATQFGFPVLSALTTAPTTTFTPTFAGATNAYTTNVAFATSSLTVTPTSSGSTITVNGTSVASGGTSGAINLNVGANTIVIALSQSGFSNTYDIIATRAPSPAVTAPASIAAVATTTTGTASAPTSFNVSGANLVGNVTVAAPTGFEVSTTSGGTYSSSITITASGTLASTPVYVRLAAADGVNSYAGNITVSTTGGLTTVNGGVISTTVAIPSSTVTLISQVITFNALPNVTYGAADFSPGAVSTNGGIPVTYTSDNLAVATIVANKIHLTGSGTANITASQLGDATHAAATSVPQGLSVGQATLTISTPAASNKPYDGGTVATVSGTLVGIINNDPITLNTTGTFASPNAGVEGVTGFGISGTNSTSYILTQPVGVTATITAISLTVNGAAAANKPYDGTTAATVSGTLVGVISPDVVTLNTTGTFASPNAGLEGVSGFSISQTGSNYTLTQPTGVTATISALALTVSGAAAADKPYDGTTAATVSGTLVGVVSPDVVTLNTTGTFASPNAGLESVSGFSISQTGSNYTLTQPTGVTATIGAIALTVSGASAADKPYDGTTTATVTGGTLVGVISPDVVTLNPTATFASANAGLEGVSGFSISQTGSNYTLTQPTGVTATITAIALTVNGAAASNKPYDGTTAATVSGTLVGVISPDVVTLNTTGTFASPNAGLEGVSGFSISQTGSNYTLTQPTGVTATISALALTVSGAAAANKPYDGTTAATVSGTLVGVVSPDVVTLNTTGTFASPNAGLESVSGFSISQTGSNYTLTQPTGVTATIGAIALTVNGASAADKPYDGTTTATVTGGTLVGVISPDVVTLNPTATFASANAGLEGVSGFSISQTGSNYTLTQPTGVTATISAIALTVNGAAAANKPYDGTTAATVSGTLVGVISPDVVTLNTTGTFASPNAGLEGVSGFSISQTGSNYTLTQPTGVTATISALALTVSGAAAANKPYDGTTAATVSGTLVGVVSPDVVTLNTTGTFASPNAGLESVSGFSISQTGSNYTLTQPTGVTATIGAIALTVSGASAADKPYDGTTTATVTGGTLVGVISPDVVTLNPTATFASANAGLEGVSGFSISQTGSNYTLTQPTGVTATISAIALTVNGAAAANKPYDGTTAATVSGTLVGVISPDVVTLNTTGTFASPNAGLEGVSGFSISQTGSNYTLTQPTGVTATISALALTVSGAAAADKPYDGTTAATVSGTLVGVVSPDVVTLNTTGTFASPNAGLESVSGFSISQTGSNYTLTQPTGVTATIGAIALTVSGASAADKPYDGTTTATVTGGTLVGVISPDVVTLNPTATFASANAGLEGVSGFSISQTGSNYTLTQPTGVTATISAIALTVNGAAAANKPYDGTTAATVSGTLVGVISPDVVTLNTTGTFASPNAGLEGVSGFSISQTGSNYTLTQPTGVTATISALALTVSGAAAADKPYDGTTAATVSGTLVGVVSPDVVTLNTTGTFASPNAGLESVSGFSISQTGSNYTLTQPTGVTATISAIALTVSGAAASDKTYDGTTTATVSGTLVGVISPDVVTLNPTATFASAAVGNWAVSGFSISQTGSNYTLTQPTGVTANILASTDATLSSLSPSTGSFNQTFVPATTTYTENVANGITSITVTPTATNANITSLTVAANGTTLPVASGSASQAITLAEGVGTVITTTVTAQDGTTKGIYTLTVTRAASAVATLSSLVPSVGSFDQAFAPGTIAYTETVANTTASMTVTPISSDVNASIKVNGLQVTSGSPSASIALAAGANTNIVVAVTSQDNSTTDTYTIVVTRPTTSNASLSTIALTPAAALTNTGTVGSTTSYTATVSNATTSVTVTPTTADPSATVQVNSVTVASGTASASISLPVGATVITTVVTAQDNVTTRTYVITVTRLPSSNAALSTIALVPATALTNTGTVGTTTTYTASVSNTTTSIAVKPTAADATATIKVNGTTVASGATSGSIALTVGANTINTVVTAADGTTTKTYSIVVTRAPSTIATLSAIALTPAATLTNTGTVGTTTSYTATASNATTSVTVKSTATDPTATITVNGTTVASGAASGSIALGIEGSTTTITIVVTAQDGVTTHTYSIAVLRAPSTISTLSSLVPSSGSFAQTFASGTTVYTESVPNATASLTLTPTTTNVHATVTVTANGVTTAVASGSASPAIALAEGINTAISVTVTAQDGVTTTTYTLTVSRAKSSVATLSSLVPSSGSIAPTFASGTLAYTESVPNATASITVTPTTTDLNASVKVNGAVVTSTTASGAIALAEGATTTITVAVTAQDGVTTQSYTLAVTRAKSSSAALSGIALTPTSTLTNAGTVGTTTTYTTTVPNATASVTLTPTTADANATVKVNGVAVTSGTASGSIALSVGATTITTIVTAQDGTTTATYLVTVTRLPSSNATLSVIKLNPAATLTNTGTVGTTTSYTTTVANATASVTVIPTAADPTATIKVNGATVASGAASGSIGLGTEGSTSTITIVVTAQDGTTTNTYSIAVTRAPSSDATLSNLVPNSGTITPTFASGTLSYTESVPNTTTTITVTPTAHDLNTHSITVTANAVTTTVASGSASPTIALGEGIATVITVTVTAQDGTTTGTYTLMVTRAASATATLSSLVPSTGTLSPAFASGTLSYTESVPNATASIAFTPAASDPNAKITVNGVAVVSGSASTGITLPEGATTTINTVVTAQNGTTTQTYSVAVTRAKSANAALSTIALTPATALTNTGTVGTTTSYTASVSNATASVTVTPTAQDANATIKVNGTTVASGTASGSIALAVGANTITTVVTAQNGTTTATYSITVTRAKSSVATLSAIKLTPASTLTNTGTTGTTTNYTTSVTNATTSVTVTATATDPTATIKVNGTTVASGVASGSIALVVGTNTITTVVTAQDGVTTRTYSIVVTRASGPLMSLHQPVQQPDISVTKPTDTVAIENDGVLVHQGVSPNGDGINDFLTIDGISAYPNNTFSVIDRNGSLVYQVKGYDNNSRMFDGHSNINGKMQQPGTYFYSLDYVVNGQTKHKTGFIILKY